MLGSQVNGSEQTSGQAQRQATTKSTDLRQSVADVSLIRSVSWLGLGLVSQTHTGQWSSWFKLTSGLGGGRTRSSPRKVTELGVHSLGLVLLRVRFSGLKLLKQVQLVSTGPSPGIALVNRTRDLSSTDNPILAQVRLG